MSEDLPPTPEPAPDPALQVAATEAVAKAEAAATRRRWINLGEFIAVAGLLIAGVTLWLNWSDRRSDLAARQSEKQAEKTIAARYEIRAVVERNDDVRVIPDDRHMLGDVTVAFPSSLGIGTRNSPAQTIPKSWYEAGLLAVTNSGPASQTGTLPVLLTVQYFDADTPLTARGVYDIVWKTEGHWPLGRSLHIVSATRRAGSATQAEVDRLWVASRVAR